MAAEPDPARECRVFTRYLAGAEPGEAVLDAYTRGLASEAFRSESNDSRFDRLMVRTAARGPLRTWGCDAYARFLHPRALLRRKLVLLLAILESRAETAETFDRADAGGVAGFLLRSVVRGVAFVVVFAVATLALSPFRLALGTERGTA